MAKYNLKEFHFSPPNTIDIKNAKLRLEFLKENFEYQSFFKKFKESPYDFLTTKRNPYIPEQHKEFSKKCETFGLNPQSERMLYIIGWPLDDFINLFDPDKKIDEIQNQELIKALPYFFSVGGLINLPPGYDRSFTYDENKTDISLHYLKPYQHILVADLRKTDKQLTDELKRFLKQQRNIQKIELKRKSAIITYCKKNGLNPEKHKEVLYESDKTYRSWIPENNRQRKEAEQQLKIWNLRKIRPKQTFKEIAAMFKITEDAAKKSFYAAWEKAQGEPYDPIEYIELLKANPIKKENLKKSCETCEDKKCLKNFIMMPSDKSAKECTPCPEVARFLHQDHVSRREKLESDRY